MRIITTVLVQIIAALFPSRLKAWLFSRLLGWEIGARTRIGLSLFLRCERVTIGAGCYIGHFNTFRRLKRLDIGETTQILNFNDFMAGHEAHWPASLSIGNHAQVTSHHFFDCSGGIQIGHDSLVGGRSAQLWTHFYHAGKVRLRSLVIGNRCYVCARATLVYCHLPDDCVVAAGAVVTGDFTGAGPGLLLAGNPASIIKRKR